MDFDPASTCLENPNELEPAAYNDKFPGPPNKMPLTKRIECFKSEVQPFTRTSSPVIWVQEVQDKRIVHQLPWREAFLHLPSFFTKVDGGGVERIFFLLSASN